MAEKVTYVSKYKQLVLVKKPMGLKDAVGNKIKTERVEFKPGIYGGMFVTDNAEMIAWLDKHEYMSVGKIQRFDPEVAEEVAGTPVIRGGVTSTPAKAGAKPPANGPKAAVKAAKVK